ncbi:MAG: periplasmic heavy metal sensor [Steroidobacteraceae bacterium]
MSLLRSVALTLLVAMSVGGLGVWVGARYVIHQRDGSSSLHDVLHQRLQLDANQLRRIADMEAQHSLRRAALQREMRAANSDLATAFERQHAYTPQVQAAIDRFHRAMGELQKETIAHTFAMRAVLTPKQAELFDATIIGSLTKAAQ